MTSRIEGIDWLRAIMSIFVVVWHMEGVGRSLVFQQSDFHRHVFDLSDVINFHLLLLAVPTFIFISIYLQSTRRFDLISLRKQIGKLFLMLCFWPVALLFYNNSYHGITAGLPRSSIGVVLYLFRAGNTIYYFFSCLIVCLLISYLFYSLSKTNQYFAFLVSIVMLALLPKITLATGFYPLCAYWSPLNFLPHSFMAVLFSIHKKVILAHKTNIILSSFVICVIFSFLEWKYYVGDVFFAGQGYAIPAYTRTSLVFAVVIVFLVALTSSLRANDIIRFMSKYSLALYLLHPFLMDPVKQLTQMFLTGKVAVYASISLVLVFSYTIAIILTRYYFKDGVI